MGNLTSRILVAALLLPVALAALWLGGWWLVALGVVAGVIAIHELCTMARDHRPVVLAACLGVVAMIVLAHVRGVAYSTEVNISLQNTHPFRFEGSTLALAHNGDLYRFSELRDLLAPADRKSTRLNSSHSQQSRMPSSA